MRRNTSSSTDTTDVQAQLEGVVDELCAYMSSTGQHTQAAQMHVIKEKIARGAGNTKSDVDDLERMLSSLCM